MNGLDEREADLYRPRVMTKQEKLEKIKEIRDRLRAGEKENNRE